jgi:hypothetical protein
VLGVKLHGFLVGPSIEKGGFADDEMVWQVACLFKDFEMIYVSEMASQIKSAGSLVKHLALGTWHLAMRPHSRGESESIQPFRIQAV